MRFNIQGKEIEIDDELITEYKCVKGFPLTDIKILRIYSGFSISGICKEELNQKINEYIADDIKMYKKLPEVITKIVTGDNEP